LRPVREGGIQSWFGWFNRGVESATGGYVRSVAYVGLRPLRLLVLFVALSGCAYWLYSRLPTSFLPQEDQGVLQTQITLPDGANAARTQAVIDLVRDYYETYEKDTVESVFMTLGFGYSSSG